MPSRTDYSIRVVIIVIIDYNDDKNDVLDYDQIAFERTLDAKREPKRPRQGPDRDQTNIKMRTLGPDQRAN